MNKPRRKRPKTKRPNLLFHLLNNSKVTSLYPLLIAVVLISLLAVYLILNYNGLEKCKTIEVNKMIPHIYNKISPKNVSKNQSLCYEFEVKEGQKIWLQTSHNVTLKNPDGQSKTFQGKEEKPLEIPGVYKLKVQKNSENFLYDMSLKVITSDFLSQNPQLSQLSPSPPEKEPRNLQSFNSSSSTPPLTPSLSNYSTQLAYNVNQSPNFYSEQKLQKIVDNIVDLAKKRGLPTRYLSISLINLNSSQCCGYAEYQQDKLRYPASVVKLFWLVAFYAQKNQQGIYPEQITPEEEKLLSKMIIDSDNESASAIVDQITKTSSTKKQLPKDEFKSWKANRDNLNKFFSVAGYDNINISQKTFPIPKLLNDPEGPDLQLRQIKGTNAAPMRNKLTTHDVARLLYEIVTKQAISQDYSEQILGLIDRNLDPNVWKEKPYDAVEEFLGEGIYKQFSKNLNDVRFYSKMGWTFGNRNDSAIILSPQANYILVIFGDHPKYYQDKKFFPLLSQEVYQQMEQISRN